MTGEEQRCVIANNDSIDALNEHQELAVAKVVKAFVHHHYVLWARQFTLQMCSFATAVYECCFMERCTK